MRRRDVVDEVINQTWTDHRDATKTNVNYGPLLTTALALFGPSSFLENHATQPGRFRAAHFLRPDAITDDDNPLWGRCMEVAPLQGLLAVDAQGDSNAGSISCVVDGLDQDYIITEYLRPFRDFDARVRDAPGPAIAGALTTAGYLAVQALFATVPPDYRNLALYYDAGADHVIPTISPADATILSLLIAVDLAALLAAALYAARHLRWTEKLDAWAMMRVGASVAEAVPLKVSWDNRTVALLDELPGRMGGGCEEGRRVARLGLGEAALRAGRAYESYPGQRRGRMAGREHRSRDPEERKGLKDLGRSPTV